MRRHKRLDTPHACMQEWEAPMPSRRPDIFPEFDKPERVFLPKPLPGDPAMPDEELEESVKRTVPGDPDPEHKTGEPVREAKAVGCRSVDGRNATS